ncbi:MAG: hypothetical protein LBP59_14695 [Planctomycetaceae bacterium]|nr:hypothetical protein [Planctomycetaceae bacterium]
MKTRKGSIKNVPLPKGSPSWNEISNMTIEEIEAGARANLTGYIQLVLEFQRFKSIKACRPKTRQATVNENSSANSLKLLKNY